MADQPMTLMEMLGRKPEYKGFRLAVHEIPHEGSVAYFAKDRPCVCRQVDDNLWVYEDWETKEIVGVKLFGAMPRPAGAGLSLRHCPYEEVIDG